VDRRVNRGQGTRQVIIDAAARLFAEHGFQAVSIEAVLQACGISRGALYHHFAGKDALFTAVLEAAELHVAEVVAAAAGTVADPIQALRAGCSAWLRLAADDPTVRRIVLTDAPSVVGWERWREIDSRHSLGLLKAALGAAAAQGLLDADKTNLYAHVLLAMLVELALLVARASDAQELIANGEEVIGQVLDGLMRRQR